MCCGCVGIGVVGVGVGVCVVVGVVAVGGGGDDVGVVDDVEYVTDSVCGGYVGRGCIGVSCVVVVYGGV